MVMPYEIWIQGYYHMSGGIRALHVLKDELNARGLQATMLYEGQRQAGTIGVYPEIVHDNPEGYENIARWLLNTADLPDDGDVFAWETGMGDYPLLTVNIIELDLWKPYSGKRSGTAFWVGKGVRQDSLIPAGAVEITRKNFPKREQLAEFIRSLDYLVSFDPFTAVNLEAVMCGTPVLVRGNHPRMSGEQIKSHDWMRYGIAYQPEDIGKARSEVHLAYEHYLSLLPVFSDRIDKFVQITQEGSD